MDIDDTESTATVETALRVPTVRAGQPVISTRRLAGSKPAPRSAGEENPRPAKAAASLRNRRAIYGRFARSDRIDRISDPSRRLPTAADWPRRRLRRG